MVGDELGAELTRLDALLKVHLAHLRRRGRTSLHDAADGMVIEESEALGLFAELALDRRVAASAIEPPAIELPGLRHATRVYGLDRFERDVLLLCLAVELDARYARLVAFLNDHVQRARPTVGLMAAVLADAAAQPIRSFAPGAPLLRHRLVVLDGDGPLVTRAVRFADDWWQRLVEALPAPELGSSLDALELAEPARAAASTLVDRLARGADRPVVLLTGPRGSGREGVARAIAQSRGWCLVRVTAAELDDAALVAARARDAAWFGGGLFVEAVTGVTPSSAAALARAEVPIFVSAMRGSIEELVAATPHDRVALELSLEKLDVEGAARLWTRRLPGTSIDFAAHASRFRFSPARIELAASLARARAGDRDIDARALAEICRQLPDLKLSELAERLSCTFGRDDLVVRPETRRELDLIVAWSRHGAQALASWGITRALGTRGLACLFSGPPGTGKTMAAQVIAREIGLDLYRIDLSNVVSKYIGETEKNLARVFDEAEQASAILFFDEADALFATRTEVRDSHDRYANLETGFLLQRIEAHHGICILATNLRRNIDDAFMRRMQIAAEFPMPDANDRVQIWRKHLPAAQHVAGEIDLQRLASRFSISGGEIRNTVLTAALLAADAGEQISMRCLVRGLWRELTKNGRIVDMSSFGEWKPEVLRYLKPANGAS